MILPQFTDPRMIELVRVLTAEIEKTFQRGRDVELARGERLILRSPDGSRFIVEVDNTGALGTTAL